MIATMQNSRAMTRCVIVAAALILCYQLFLPPFVGLADQSDFKRVIGRFGYGPEERGNLVGFVPSKYVPDPAYRAPEWEQISSEYLFVEVALLINRIVSKDGKLDIRVMGLVHSLAFLAVFARFLYVTQNSPTRVFLWIATLLITTDVAHVAYFNSFYAESASFLFCLLLLAESIELSAQGTISTPTVFVIAMVRWAVCASLLVLAKPQNAPLAGLLAIFPLRFGLRRTSWIASAGILAAGTFSLATAPAEMKDANTYNLVFLSILPESRNPAKDVLALGLEPGTEDYSRTGAWSPNSAFIALKQHNTIGRRLNLMTVVRFYLLRPTRLWRHIQVSLPIALLARPDLGNFDRSAGYGPVAKSKAFAIWSGFHERILSRIAKLLLFSLPVPAIAVLLRRMRGRASRPVVELWALLGLCSLTAFLTAIFGDAWDTVKHLFLFNFLLDAYLCSTAMLGWVALVTSWRTQTRRHARMAMAARAIISQASSRV